MDYTEEEKEALNAIKIVRAYMKNNLYFEKDRFVRMSTSNSKLDSLLFDLQEEIIGKAEFR